jgi:hypothetical protein
MRLQNVVLRDDIMPYQRYDLEYLLPGMTLCVCVGTTGTWRLASLYDMGRMSSYEWSSWLVRA